MIDQEEVSVKKTNSIKNVVLHIGFPKTATTSIQKTLFENERPSQYCYPKSWPENHGTALLQMFIDESYGELFYFLHTAHNLDASISNEMKEQHKTNLMNELHQTSAETLIISAEIASIFPEKALIELKRFLFSVCESTQINISVVACIRSPASNLTSSFQQLVHKAYYTPMSGVDRVSEINARPDMGLTNFLKVFGEENVRLFKFEDALLHEYGPVGFFYEKCLAFELLDIKTLDIQKTNERRSQIAVDIGLFINENVPMFNKEKTALAGHRTRGDLQLIAENISGPRFQLPKEILYSHLDRCKQQLEYMETTFKIKYSSEKIKREIESGMEISHIPTIKNLEEIDTIFYRLDSTIQCTLIEYLKEIKCKLHDNHSLSESLMHLISKLEKKETALIK